MKNSFLLKVLLAFLPLFSYLMPVSAQLNQWRDVYKVKKKDTLYGIANNYGITIPQLIEANPEMKKEGYMLKKGDTIFIPYKNQQPAQETKPAVVAKKGLDKVKIGVMLPLHNVDGDGHRMVEYYRGVLMACDSLKAHGISTEVHAWNVPADADIRQVLLQEGAKDCNIIFGPLYTTQVKHLSTFCQNYGIKMVIPFSINGDEVAHNPQLFQVYQNPTQLNDAAIKAFHQQFAGCHPVFIDCNDATSQKGKFTFGLRHELESKGIKYNITNLESSEELFAKCFSRKQPNVVILNTGRSPELNVAMAKLQGLLALNPAIKVKLYGYTEWLMYTKYQLNNFFKFDTYIPTTYYYNPLDKKTTQLEQSYRQWFRTEMQQALPRFAITGYDQAQYFIRGLHEYGKDFDGRAGQSKYKPMQTPLKFTRIANGGMQNTQFMLIHYTPDLRIESIAY